MIALIHLTLATVEFLLINWLGGHALSAGYHQITFIQTVEESPLFNVVFRVLAPTVFLALTAALWYAIGFDAVVRQYWHVTGFYFVLRWGFNLSMGRARLLDWWKQAAIAALAISLSYVVAEELLAHRDAVLPSARALTDELWIVVIGFLYLTANRVSWPRVGPSTAERKKHYLRAQYERAKQRFGSVIAEYADDEASVVLSYAILIYETFNRPRLVQLLESWLLFPIGVANTLGPMQVTTPVRLSDEELVRDGVEHVNSALSAAFEQMRKDAPAALTIKLRRAGGYEAQYVPGAVDLSAVRFEDVSSYYQLDLVRRAAAKYNVRSDYPAEVAGIFDFLVISYYPDLRPDSGDASLRNTG